MPETIFCEGDVYLISDLHLEEERPDITRAFLNFLQSIEPTASSLFILGDFFEVWVGDDNPAVLNLTVRNALKKLYAHGCKIYLMHGNRDFLIGDQFAREAGATLISEPCLLQYNDQQFLLLHGDSLCTDDVDYQKFRAMVRASHWQHEFLSNSLDERLAFARKAREKSAIMTSEKNDDIMDVNQHEVEEHLQQFNVDTIIHGHTHRPAVHQFNAGKKQCTRFVLGDWNKDVWFLKLELENIALHHYPLTENPQTHP